MEHLRDVSHVDTVRLDLGVRLAAELARRVLRRLVHHVFQLLSCLILLLVALLEEISRAAHALLCGRGAVRVQVHTGLAGSGRALGAAARIGSVPERTD